MELFSWPACPCRPRGFFRMALTDLTASFWGSQCHHSYRYCLASSSVPLVRFIWIAVLNPVDTLSSLWKRALCDYGASPSPRNTNHWNSRCLHEA
ncbi:hypothetical protein VTN00DRAFT_4266 [Thermoascus crustaceus]|uniref:uncharacterized protein n=1 Tax=Thermoascus crustaceus TaxID=5088 RepID=UPI0037427666